MRVLEFTLARAGSQQCESGSFSILHRNVQPGLSDLPFDTVVNSQRGYEALAGGYVTDRRKRLCEPEMAGYYGSARPLSTRTELDPGYLNDAEAGMQKITPLKAEEGIAA
jgi:hypothetical protein